MLTFRNTNIFFGLLLAITVGLYLAYAIPVWIFVVLVLSYLLILVYGCYYIRSGFFMPVICEVPGIEKQIVLSFDDGPHPEYTRQILDVLDKHHARACFFCVGKNVADYPAIFKDILNRNHLVGNHSFSHHPFFDLWSAGRMLADLQQMDKIVKMETGYQLRLFRPPYGVMNPALKKAILTGKYIPIGWNMRSYDTMATDQTKLLNKLVKALGPGKIYLLHDRMQITAQVLDKFLEEVKTKGYTVVALNKALTLQPYA